MKHLYTDEAVHAGLTLILADAARFHLADGDLEKAELCIPEALRHLALLAKREPSAEKPRSVYA